MMTSSITASSKNDHSPDTQHRSKVRATTAAAAVSPWISILASLLLMTTTTTTTCTAKNVLSMITLIQTSFYAQNICISTQDIDDGQCIVRIPAQQSRSRVECGILCMKDGHCTGFSELDPDSCFLHYSCSTNVTDYYSCCDNFGGQGQEEGEEEIQHHLYFSMHCDNGGEWNPDTSRCICHKGWVGEFCRERPAHCLDLTVNGYPYGNYSTVLDPHRDGSVLIPVVCVTKEDEYFHIMAMCSDGYISFNKSWDDYRLGFSNKDWIGLQHWHALSQLGYNTMQMMVSVEGLGTLQRKFDRFKVHDENQSFSFEYNFSEDVTSDADRVQFQSRNFTLGDCFASHMSVPFSTWDRSQGGPNASNCASSLGHGWWFTQCNPDCNIMGGETISNGITSPGELFIKGIHDSHTSEEGDTDTEDYYDDYYAEENDDYSDQYYGSEASVEELQLTIMLILS